ncbi:MAG: SDR family NAD(P)-dependent oxidoreductase [Gammaproteobacteria bacterium]|nr:SDR family NAD(P)-dependent oxidoreductase [Gammaproteobacteria bacterium]MDE2022721.1 SDR family NAD(P)-dependent oxidoreductase [Gammaproteobacteria bacterium]MDE2272734.1 SDR family NAD(P)-dependent oxidoreductase [Gammaproteobacteria bacterium]
MELRQQIVLVTGAGRGLGTAIARALAGEGARRVVNYRHSREPAEALAAKFGPKPALAFSALPRFARPTTRLSAPATSRTCWKWPDNGWTASSGRGDPSPSCRASSCARSVSSRTNTTRMCHPADGSRRCCATAPRRSRSISRRPGKSVSTSSRYPRGFSPCPPAACCA